MRVTRFATRRTRTTAPPNPDVSDARDSDAEKRRRANKTRETEPSAAAVAPVPAHIAAKYLVKGNTYHFDDQTVAFVDKGTSLTVQTHNKAIIQDLVAIAKARDWQAVTVSGTQAFRREAWKAAASAGLTVSGYTPSEIERVAVERERSRRDASIPSEPSPRESGSARDQPESATPRESSAESPSIKTSKGVRYGTLVAHGEAPYRHDATQSASYFVTLRDAAGQERTSWGVGLKDAFRESKTTPAVNDLIGIRRAGSTPVTVVERIVDENGEVIAQAIDAKRHNWEVEKAEYFTQRSGAPPAGSTFNVHLVGENRCDYNEGRTLRSARLEDAHARSGGGRRDTQRRDHARGIATEVSRAQSSRVSAFRIARPVCRRLRQEWSDS